MVIILKRHNRHKKKNRSFKIAYISAFTGIFAIFLFLGFFTALSMFIDFSEMMYRISSFIVLIAGAFVSGRTGAFFNRSNGIRTGIRCCIPVILFALLISCNQGTEETFFGIVRGVLSGLAAGCAGGVIGVNSTMNIRKYKKINNFLHDT